MFRGGKPDVRSAKAAGTASWGISHDIIEDLRRCGVEILVVFEKESTLSYWVDISVFMECASFRTFDGDMQMFLPLNKWKTTKDYSKFINILAELSRKRAA